MNRRSAIKAAIAGVAAAIGWKVSKPQTITFPHSFEGKVESWYWSVINQGVSVNDARLLETRTFSVEDLKRWYRIPDGVL